ncbi:uncharacterized protein LOC125043070 [Penaeus chinensis]|uniref:uncharacterized protein LOC125043070 n=1 Tax=Penaeus chinensis TaxID=139456 RepID=UPI001FB70BA6|nr:uncharacterized protein LOC125043070 [Penaeus chinensis]
MNSNPTEISSRIACRADKQGARTSVANQVGDEKWATGSKTSTTTTKTKLLKAKENILQHPLDSDIEDFYGGLTDLFKRIPRLDNIPAEVWKSQALMEELLVACNKAYNGDVPSIWTKSCIVPIPKKGDLSITSNYRGICLTCVLQGDTLAPFLFIICLDYAMRTTIDDNTQLGFTLHQRKSRRQPAVKITDMDFADDIALLSDASDDAATLLHKVEEAAQEIGLYINESKTEYICFGETGQIVAKNGINIKRVNNFQYLGSWLNTTKHDVEIRIALAWAAHSKMKTIWRSNLSRSVKINFFRAAVESILLYGSESWTLTSQLTKELDGAYTRLLRATLNISWNEHCTNKDLYKDIPMITKTIKSRRLRFAGHCWRSNELVHDLLFWEPSQGKIKRGRPAKTYIKQLAEDTGLSHNEMQNAMRDRQTWRRFVMGGRASPG